MSFSRVSKAMLPASKCLCRVNNWCVYRSKYDSCDNPRINKGNSDAACWRLSNKALLAVLITLPVRTDYLGNSKPDKHDMEKVCDVIQDTMRLSTREVGR
jgi:hypothetical protein